MSNFARAAIIVACAAASLPISAKAEESVFVTGRLLTEMRAMIGKPLLEQSVDLSNKSPFVLEALTPEGSRFFYGGNAKDPGETADDMRLAHRLIVLITPCNGQQDLSAKVSSVALWETISFSIPNQDAAQDKSEIKARLQRLGLGMEQLLAMMNTPPGVVTPSTLRAPHGKGLHGPVFEYVRGDTTETLSLLNEGEALRINWVITNTGICPH